MCTHGATSEYFPCCCSRQEGQQEYLQACSAKTHSRANIRPQGQRGLGSCGIVCGRCHGNISWLVTQPSACVRNLQREVLAARNLPLLGLNFYLPPALEGNRWLGRCLAIIPRWVNCRGAARWLQPALARLQGFVERKEGDGVSGNAGTLLQPDMGAGASICVSELQPAFFGPSSPPSSFLRRLLHLKRDKGGI